MNPESVPAPKRAQLVGRGCNPVVLRRTANSTIKPNINVISLSGITASVAAPSNMPGTCPTSAHFRPETSIERRSRCNINSASTKTEARTGLGTNRGLIRARVGAVTNAKPKPTDPCNVAPTATTAHAAPSSKGVKSVISRVSLSN